jgi:isopentenyl phosphate kinase
VQTNVSGIYDRPPEQPGAQRIARLQVNAEAGSSGSGRDVSPDVTAYTQQGSLVQSLQTSTAAHDTTGGIAAKIQEAAAVARLGAEVRISKAGSPAALAACLPGTLPPDWEGTIVCCSRLQTR